MNLFMSPFLRVVGILACVVFSLDSLTFYPFLRLNLTQNYARLLEMVVGRDFAFGEGSGQATVHVNWMTMPGLNQKILGIHTVLAAMALLCALPQFVGSWRTRYPSWHKKLGKLYFVFSFVSTVLSWCYLYLTPTQKIYGGNPFALGLWGIGFQNMYALLAGYRDALSGNRWWQHNSHMTLSFSTMLIAPLLRFWWMAFGLAFRLSDFKMGKQQMEAHVAVLCFIGLQTTVGAIFALSFFRKRNEQLVASGQQRRVGLPLGSLPAYASDAQNKAFAFMWFQIGTVRSCFTWTLAVLCAFSSLYLSWGKFLALPHASPAAQCNASFAWTSLLACGPIAAPHAWLGSHLDGIEAEVRGRNVFLFTLHAVSSAAACLLAPSVIEASFGPSKPTTVSSPTNKNTDDRAQPFPFPGGLRPKLFWLCLALQTATGMGKSWVLRASWVGGWGGAWAQASWSLSIALCSAASVAWGSRGDLRGGKEMLLHTCALLLLPVSFGLIFACCRAAGVDPETSYLSAAGSAGPINLSLSFAFTVEGSGNSMRAFESQKKSKSS